MHVTHPCLVLLDIECWVRLESYTAESQKQENNLLLQITHLVNYCITQSIVKGQIMTRSCEYQTAVELKCLQRKGCRKKGTFGRASVGKSSRQPTNQKTWMQNTSHFLASFFLPCCACKSNFKKTKTKRFLHASVVWQWVAHKVRTKIPTEVTCFMNSGLADGTKEPVVPMRLKLLLKVVAFSFFCSSFSTVLMRSGFRLVSLSC